MQRDVSLPVTKTVSRKPMNTGIGVPNTDFGGIWCQVIYLLSPNKMVDPISYFLFPIQLDFYFLL